MLGLLVTGDNICCGWITMIGLTAYGWGCECGKGADEPYGSSWTFNGVGLLGNNQYLTLRYGEM